MGSADAAAEAAAVYQMSYADGVVLTSVSLGTAEWVREADWTGLLQLELEALLSSKACI